MINAGSLLQLLKSVPAAVPAGAKVLPLLSGGYSRWRCLGEMRQSGEGFRLRKDHYPELSDDVILNLIQHYYLAQKELVASRQLIEQIHPEQLNEILKAYRTQLDHLDDFYDAESTSGIAISTRFWIFVQKAVASCPNIGSLGEPEYRELQAQYICKLIESGKLLRKLAPMAFHEKALFRLIQRDFVFFRKTWFSKNRPELALPEEELDSLRASNNTNFSDDPIQEVYLGEQAYQFLCSLTRTEQRVLSQVTLTRFSSSNTDNREDIINRTGKSLGIKKSQIYNIEKRLKTKLRQALRDLDPTDQREFLKQLSDLVNEKYTSREWKSAADRKL